MFCQLLGSGVVKKASLALEIFISILIGHTWLSHQNTYRQWFLFSPENLTTSFFRCLVKSNASNIAQVWQLLPTSLFFRPCYKWTFSVKKKSHPNDPKQQATPALQLIFAVTSSFPSLPPSSMLSISSPQDEEHFPSQKKGEKKKNSRERHNTHTLLKFLGVFTSSTVLL